MVFSCSSARAVDGKRGRRNGQFDEGLFRQDRTLELSGFGG